VVTESEHITILEAARRCGVSDKTIQRAIRRGILPARYPQPNRCEIALSDLGRITPVQVSGHTTEPLENRIAELEQRVQDLEDQVQRLLKRQEAPKTRRISPPAKEDTTGPLPRQFVSLLAFALDHNVAKTKVQTHVDIGLLPAKRGEWTDADGTVVTLALDAKGKAAFFQIYRSFPMFLACKQCPHGYLDMSRQNREDVQT
jgi:DNA-binding transcriptional MerR regulator